jgi:hypothetical protein
VNNEATKTIVTKKTHLNCSAKTVFCEKETFINIGRHKNTFIKIIPSSIIGINNETINLAYQFCEYVTSIILDIVIST